MSKIKSFSVGEGDMFCIDHNSDNFTIIDCCLSDDNAKQITDELLQKSKSKGITRFISTHPDEDHVQKLDYLDDALDFVNFYVVKNDAHKPVITPGLERYFSLRDSSYAFYISQGCVRKWMNIGDGERDPSGISVLWPNIANSSFKEELEKAKKGEAFNNISPIIRYAADGGVSALWLGDMETTFMEKIKDEVTFPETTILFAPHHGRKSGKVIKEWLDQIKPKVVIIGECPSEHLYYYPGYDRITQNSAGDILFNCEEKSVHIYVSNSEYSTNFLRQESQEKTLEGLHYLGTLDV